MMPAQLAGAATDGPEDAQASVEGLEQAVSGALVSQHGSETNMSFGQRADAALQTLVEPKRYAAGGTWVFGGGVIRVPSDIEASPTALLFLAQRVGGQWHVALEGSPEFAAAARTAPVLTDAEKLLFGKPAVRPFATETGLALPWTLGQGWGHWGVHGDSGESQPYNSIDFFGGDGQVRASQAGHMYRFCTSAGQWPFIKVVHHNGYTTGYYHLRDTTTKGDGSEVTMGEYIGRIDVQLPCGGRANGNHVHWTLWSGNSPVTVADKTIGGWTWYAGSQAYQGHAERDGQVIYRNSCCRLVNHGSGQVGGPSPTPAASASPSAPAVAAAEPTRRAT
jgi:LasA protease